MEPFPYIIVRRRVRYARLEFTPQGLQIVVPTTPDFQVDEFIERHKTWLKRKMVLYAQLADTTNYTLIDRPVIEFKRLVQEYVALASAAYKVQAQSINYRTMKNRWGSCTSKGELKFNNNLRFLPDELVRYVVFHEACHLQILRHNTDFKHLLSSQFPDYKQLDKQLLGYWHRLNQK